MRIADPNSPGNALPAASPPAPPPHTAAAGTVSVASDRTELSGVADRLSDMLQTESATPADRIQQLKEAITSGDYQVDAAAVSHALVEGALSAGSDPNLEKK
jgi:flagellar biosynthesis anti-sigma factor FlgM